MAYLVNLTARAQRDLAHLYGEINAEIRSRAEMVSRAQGGDPQPGRTAKPLPRDTRERRLRHLLYGNKPHIYRVIYRVLEKQKQVEVLHIRHGARRASRRPDID